jgi:hypothetical protein
MTLNNYSSKGQSSSAFTALKETASPGYNKIANGPEVWQNRVMRCDLTNGDHKRQNKELSWSAENGNYIQNKFREPHSSTRNDQPVDVSQHPSAVARQRHEIDRCRQLHHQQQNNPWSISAGSAALGDVLELSVDWEFPIAGRSTINDQQQQQQRRCSRHDDFRRTALMQRNNSSSPALVKPKRDRDGQQQIISASGNNTNSATSNINRLQDSRLVFGSPFHVVPEAVEAMLSPPPPPPPPPPAAAAQSDWVVRRRADGTRYVARRRHSVRDRILRERERRLAEERRSTTTTTTTTTEEDDAVVDGQLHGVRLRWSKNGHYCSREVRRRQLAASRERKSRRQKALLQRLCEAQGELQKTHQSQQLSALRGVLTNNGVKR